MSGNLIYVSGPSGSGKDSLLRYAREQLSGHVGICFAHRYITRAADAGSENHVALSPEEFAARSSSDLFALNWTSNGLQYGIGAEIDHWLDKGLTVVMNGSREYLPHARTRYPHLVPVEIAVPQAVLRERLLARGRETVEQVEQRLRRNHLLEQRAGKVEIIRNDGDLGQAGEALVSLILRCAEPS